jgi:hypothetical protein
MIMGAALNAAGASANIVDPDTTVEELMGKSDKVISGTVFQVQQALQKYLVRTLPNNIPTSRPSFDNLIIQQSGKVRIRPADMSPGANYAGHDTVHDNGREVRALGRRWGL